MVQIRMIREGLAVVMKQYKVYLAEQQNNDW